MKYDSVLFLENCTEPWVKYNTYINILDGDVSDIQANQLKQEMLEHEKIRELIKECMNWPNECAGMEKLEFWTEKAVFSLADI